MKFKDHFSTQTQAYATSRPSYPQALFDDLAERAPACDNAWDVACGTGQATAGLSKVFANVTATDASAKQIANARPLPGVAYRVGSAEDSDLAAASTDLVCIAQALHWLDTPRFYAEAKRVLRPGGLLCAISYPLMKIDAELDQLVWTLYSKTLGPWWPPERAHVENGYRDLGFPEPRLATPAFEMALEWSLDTLTTYLRSWSATARAQDALQDDPLRAVLPALQTAWGDAETRRVRWPLLVLLWQKEYP